MGRIQPAGTVACDNGAGWNLQLRRYADERTQVAGLRPLVFVPGYAMNAHILALHPGGPSMVEHLVSQGFEVWTANLRGQGESVARGKPARWGLGELALDDLAAVLDVVRRTTTTGSERVDLLGCSLGASMVYAWLAHHPKDHGVGSAVAIGGPLRWDAMHPLMKVAFASPALAGALRVKGTRFLAARALPLLTKVPSLLSIYMNADGIDLSAASDFVPTVDDPVPWINRQIAHWSRHKDLMVRGLNVSEGLRDVHDVDVLAVVANRDGIVPPAAARSVSAYLRPEQLTMLEVGTAEHWYAHADLFIGRRAQQDVFDPMGRWLLDHNRP